MNRQSMFLVLFTAFSLLAVSCDKDDDDDDNNEDIVEVNGLVLAGSQEVPVKVSSATGSADVSFNKQSKIMSFTLRWYDLSGLPTGAHIHGAAARGANAPIKFDFFSSFPQTTTGSYSDSVLIDGSAIKEDSLLTGFYYFNIHTPTNPGGEIRGQIEF